MLTSRGEDRDARDDRVSPSLAGEQAMLHRIAYRLVRRQVERLAGSRAAQDVERVPAHASAPLGRVTACPKAPEHIAPWQTEEYVRHAHQGRDDENLEP